MSVAQNQRFEDYAQSQWHQLMRSGWLLTGNWAAAEDLVQSTLTLVWQSWEYISALDYPAAYVRRVMTNEYISTQRRRAAHEHPTDPIPEHAGPDAIGDSDLRLALIQALDGLPPLQRAAVILRYFDDLSIEQTAEALNCSVGNVKSQTSRALRKLRTSVGIDLLLKETI
jgi:RNA polymerase sigma-70 factor (sigma-E family)